MTIIHNTNTISTTIGELHDLLRVVMLNHGENPDTIINIKIDDRGNGEVSTPELGVNTEGIEL